jgi:hypothetical protein
MPTFSCTSQAPTREGGFEMPTEKEQKPQETREADTERKDDIRQDNPKEAHEGSPGYGQPPGEVRENQLPDQKW